MENLRIDCGTCRARGPACDGCMMTALLGMPGGVIELGEDEQVALESLAASGLLPPLRLVRPLGHPAAGAVTGRARESTEFGSGFAIERAVL